MTDLTGKQISQSYKQLLKVATSANTGVTNDLVQVETGDGTNTALQISTSIINITGSFGVTENASVSGDLLVGSKVCASAFYGDGSNLTNVPASGDVSVSTLRVTNNATIAGTLSVTNKSPDIDALLSTPKVPATFIAPVAIFIAVLTPSPVCTFVRDASTPVLAETPILRS